MKHGNKPTNKQTKKQTHEDTTKSQCVLMQTQTANKTN
jgi:hypothetical protein